MCGELSGPCRLLRSAAQPSFFFLYGSLMVDEVVRGSHYVFHVASPLPAPGVCRLPNMHADRGITGCALLMAPSGADAESLHPAMTYPLTAAKRS
jgi:hypothetical protein